MPLRSTLQTAPKLQKHDDAFTFTLKDFLRRMCNQGRERGHLNPKCNLLAS